MSLIKQLAEVVGFHDSYLNCFGEQVQAKDEALYGLLSAMGYDVDNEQALQESITELSQRDWRKMLPNVFIAKLEQSHNAIVVSLPDGSSTLQWEIMTEQGETISGSAERDALAHVEHTIFDGHHFNKFNLGLPALAAGYHTIKVTYDGVEDTCHLICAPQTCYSPQEASEPKVWGYAAQLYSLKSKKNWGMGDFSDLEQLVDISAKQGASAIGLNPLHPLYQNNPGHRSPYSPTSRCFLNSMYIDVTKAPGFSDSKEAQKLVDSKEFKARIAEAKASEQVDYVAVAGLKFPVLELNYQAFAGAKDKALTSEFEAFKAENGDALMRHATFEALYEYFRQKDFHAFGWKTWPAEYQQPGTDAVIAFQKEYADRVDYFAYVQWVAHRQLKHAKDQTAEKGMPIGLYLDLAVGCDGSGVDVWSDRNVYVAGAAVGAPPDAMNTLGQDWGLTPMNPVALQEQGYQPLVRALRSSMQYAGALRIDHILGLMRQYWVAPGMKPDEGVYITYPLEDILRIIALESRRTECVVIGEDLGTVPDGFGEIMAAAGLLSYKVLFFETWESGLFMRPEEYPAQSMVTVSTHDLHTLAGWWTGRDLEWRQNLNLYPNEEMGPQDRAARIQDRQYLIDALVDLGTLAAEDAPSQAPAKMNRPLSVAVQRYLARCNSHVHLIPMEDALELAEQVNIPGTIDEHPNWLQKLPVTLDEFAEDEGVVAVASAMAEERPR